MGYNTTVLILNDALDQIRKNPEQFTEGIYQQILTGEEGGVSVGNHCNPVHVMKTQHADVPRLYWTGMNSIMEFTPEYAENRGLDRLLETEWGIRIVEQELKDARRLIKSVANKVKKAKECQ